MVGNFRDRSDGAAGRANGITLAKGDGGGDALNALDAGTIHPFEKLAGVGAKGFGVAALALRVEGIEGERGFAGAGGSREHMKYAER